ncbi:hypothetical protein LP415_03935 [Polaromonas sp. P1(28)-8]|nr:hypothetical protein LP415_03935 [Polaromonas sp. P1(28)-8]
MHATAQQALDAQRCQRKQAIRPVAIDGDGVAHIAAHRHAQGVMVQVFFQAHTGKGFDAPHVVDSIEPQ